MAQIPEDVIEHRVQFFADVFGQEAEHEVAVLLQQLVLAAAPTVRRRIAEMLRAIDLNGEACVRTQQIDLEPD